jgi:surface polysaccharide O-acyltransferase-like enzyme
MQIPLGMLLGPPWVHLWFLYMLVGLYLLTPLLRRLIAQCEQVHVEYLLALFFIVGYGVPFLNILLDYLPYSIIKGRDLYLPISELTGFAGYYIAGYYVTHFKIGKRLKTILYSAAIVSMLLTILGNYWDSAYKGKAMETFFGNLLPNTMFVTYGIFLLFQDLFCERNFARKTKAIIVHLSNHSFGIYLVHILVIWIFEILNINIFTIDLPLIICIPVFSVVVMILSYMAAVFLSKIPVRKKYITLGVFLVCAFGIGISHSVSERAQQVPVSTFTETLSPIEAMHVSSANHGMEIERLIKSGVSYESETIQRLVREQQRLKNQIDSANEVIKTQEEL